LIYDAQIETRPDGDMRVLKYLEGNGYYNCIDFGGVQRPWAARHVTTYVDLTKPEDWEKRFPDMYDNYPEIWKSKVVNADIDRSDTWSQLGEYDFAISTHTLEHLANPSEFLRRLPRVASRGYIAIPNKVFELGRGREMTEEGLTRCGLIGFYRGAMPHRWIFTIKENVLWIFPKLGSLDLVEFPFEDELRHYKPIKDGQLGFMWEKDIPFRYVTDKDIVPNPQRAIEFYKEHLNEGL